MAKPIDPNPQASDFSDAPVPRRPPAEKVYRQAVAAFKAGQYGPALAQFQRLGHLPPGSAYQLKGLMGQVRIHQQLGQVDQARRVCQQLLGSPAQPARQWATQVLSQLPDPPVDLPSEPTSLLDQRAAPAKPSGNEPIGNNLSRNDRGNDLSGFVPIDSAPPPRRTATRPLPAAQDNPPGAAIADPSAVRPSEPNAPQPAALSPAASRPATSRPDPTAPSAPAPNNPDPDHPESEGRSLFHYQQLNRRPSAPAHPPGPSLVSSAQPAEEGAEPEAPLPLQQPQATLPQRPWGLWAAQMITAIAVLWAINWALHAAIATLDRVLSRVRWPLQLGIPGADAAHTPWLVAALGLLALASPWLLDYALRTGHGQTTLSTRQLQAQSPAALRLLHQVCRQQGWLLPELRLIPSPAPLCFSYGWLPRHTRIVVSQGLLDRFSQETLAALYGYELARMVNGSLPVLSAVALPLVLLHALYQRLASLGDRLPQPLLRSLVGLAATACYGLFWLLRQAVLWLSRLCCSWADRRGVALTQRPDALALGLLDLSAAIAQDLQRQGQLHPLHISLDCLMPVSGRQAILPVWGAAPPPDSPAATLASLDSGNPYRQWLRGNASHPPLGERLLWLQQQALGRGLPGLGITLPVTASVSPSLLLLQKSPLAGLIAGGGLALALWFLGGIVNRLGWVRLSWLYQDPSVLAGGLWLGLGLGLLLRINALFPDRPGQRLPSGQAAPRPDTVAAALHRAAPLPVQGKPITLQGKLLGTAGLGNYGCQDLYLADETGAVRLVNPVPLNSLQSPVLGSAQPLNWVGRQVLVTGWSRYGGGLFWVDIDQIKVSSQPPFTTYGPLWATGLSLAISLLGIVTIVRGG